MGMRSVVIELGDLTDQQASHRIAHVATQVAMGFVAGDPDEDLAWAVVEDED